MRFLAAIYLLIYILLLIPMLSKLLGRVKVYSEGLFIAVFAVLIFGDTAMITRFASFYTQPIELILMVALANCVLQIPLSAADWACRHGHPDDGGQPVLRADGRRLFCCVLDAHASQSGCAS